METIEDEGTFKRKGNSGERIAINKPFIVLKEVLKVRKKRK